MFNVNESADPEIHNLAIRIARRSRSTIQAVLREDEWQDAEREFYTIAREELERFLMSRVPHRGEHT